MIGDLAEGEARLADTGKTSRNTAGEVRAGDMKLGQMAKFTECVAVCVAVAPDGKTIPVEAWQPETTKLPLHNSGEATAVGSGWAARRLFVANSAAIGKKNNEADRPTPANHRPQGVMQRAPSDIALAQYVKTKTHLDIARASLPAD